MDSIRVVSSSPLDSLPLSVFNLVGEDVEDGDADDCLDDQVLVFGQGALGLHIGLVHLLSQLVV